MRNWVANHYSGYTKVGEDTSTYEPDRNRFNNWQAWMVSGRMTGRERPVGRVAWSDDVIKSQTSNKPGPWRWLQGQSEPNLEIPGVRSIEIDRSLGDDSATCRIVVVNDLALSDGNPEGVDSLGRPGYLTYSRGTTLVAPRHSEFDFYASSDYLQAEGIDPSATYQDTYDELTYRTGWQYPKGYWYDKLIPNRLLRTYQGYGSDNHGANGHDRAPSDPDYVAPWDDAHLIITGTWLIDTVTFGTDGLVTITCRDLGKLLLEQVVYPPMIPLARFPLKYCPDEAAVAAQSAGATVSTNRISYPTNHLGAAHEQHTDTFPGGYVYGHHARDAFDDDSSTYYLSHSYPSSTGDYEKEWIQGECGGATINQVRLNMVGTGYVMYVSVLVDGEWEGGSIIPYSAAGWDHSHGSGIPYVAKYTLGKEHMVINLPRAYKAQVVRLTFTHLRDFGLDPLPYRVGVRTFQAHYYTPDAQRAVTYTPGTIGVPGYIDDWSSVIKELIGWAGFAWRVNTNEIGELAQSVSITPSDPLLGEASNDGVSLRVWADIEFLGAGPIECTPPDYFLNKSFMECCKQVADFIGAVFYIDEWGRPNFRMPNIFGGGNLPQNPHLSAYHTPGQTLQYEPNSWPIEFHENANLLEYSVTIDDSQVRSEVLVVGTNPDVNSAAPLAGGVVLSGPGAASAVNFTNVLGGQYRLFLVPGESTKGFHRVEECQRMAELIGMKILFSYRKGQAKIIAHPYLQIDDQVRIYERVTNEINVHYVSGISSQMDLESGSYTMDVTTHWLGQDPSTDWFVDYLQLTPAVRNLAAVLKRLAVAT
jgi:hypothetical protein